MPSSPAPAASQGAAIPALRESALRTPRDLAERRAAVGALPPHAAHPECQASEISLGGVRCLSFTPAAACGTILYLHGGGYRLGSPELFAPFAEQLALATGERVVAVDYRLAPEHPFPAALHDALAAFRELAAGGEDPPAGTPAVLGDSAGGGLAAALVRGAGALGLPRPRALVLLSAWLDLRCTAESFRSRAESDPLFPLAEATGAAELYLQGWPATDPLASPALGELGGFPPTQLFASTTEALLDDTLAMAAGLARAGTSVDSRILQGLPHAWPSTDTHSAAATATLRAIGGFLAKHTAAA